MNWTRLILILCVFLLCACLVFAVTALTVLRNAVAETGKVRTDAQALLNDLGSYLEVREKQTSSAETDEPAKQVSVLYDTFCVQESGGRVAIYTGTGELVRLTDIPVAALPQADREALREGIRFSSWKEVLALMQDYEQ